MRKILISVFIVFLVSLMFVSAVAVAPCYDNDPSNNVTIGGTVTIDSEVTMDQCNGANNIQEYECKETGNHWSAHPVESSCGQGYHCVDVANGPDYCAVNNNSNVPEFSAVAAGISFVGAAAGFIFLRRK